MLCFLSTTSWEGKVAQGIGKKFDQKELEDIFDGNIVYACVKLSINVKIKQKNILRCGLPFKIFLLKHTTY